MIMVKKFLKNYRLNYNVELNFFQCNIEPSGISFLYYFGLEGDGSIELVNPMNKMVNFKIVL